MAASSHPTYDAAMARRWVRWLRWSGVAVLASLVGCAALLLVKNEAFVYHPLPTVEHTPDELGLAYEPVSFTTDDAETLHGWYVRQPGSRGTILYFHGNAGNIGHRMLALQGFAGLPVDVFIFDYRGYGDSSGHPTEEGTYRDMRAAWAHLVDTRGIDARRIVLWGRSLGGALAIALAAEVEAAGLVVESTFTSIPDLGEELYPWLPVRRWSNVDYPSLDRMAEVSEPLFLAYSPGDEMIAPHHAERLYAAAKPPKQRLRMEGSHNGAHLTDVRHRDDVLGFLDRVLPAEPGPADPTPGP